MKKTDKNIIEAGITSIEFDDLFAGDITEDTYLLEYPSQTHRYGHLADLASMRGDLELSDYFRVLSGAPKFIDFCD